MLTVQAKGGKICEEVSSGENFTLQVYFCSHTTSLDMSVLSLL